MSLIIMNTNLVYSIIYFFKFPLYTVFWICTIRKAKPKREIQKSLTFGGDLLRRLTKTICNLQLVDDVGLTRAVKLLRALSTSREEASVTLKSIVFARWSKNHINVIINKFQRKFYTDTSRARDFISVELKSI